MPRLADFEQDDQQQLKPTNASLLEFANQHGLRVTSGYSAGGHNSGSKHYQGDAQHPGAIDIDHRGVNYNKLLAWAQPKGYRVLDERTRPAGQKVWGGPHYHIEMSNGQPVAVSSKPAQAREIAQAPKREPIKWQGPSLAYDENGVLVEQGQQEAFKIKRQGPTPKASVSLSDFELDDNDLAEVQAMADRLRPKPEPEAAPAPVRDPSFIEGLGNVANAAGQFLYSVPGQIAQGFQTEGQAYQANPFRAGLERYATIIPQAVEGVRDLAQAPADLSAAIGNAYLGRQEFKPGYQLPSTRDISVPGGKTLGQIYDQFPVSGFVAENAIPVELGVGAAVKGLRNLGKVATTAEDLARGKSGFVGRDGLEINPRLTPEEEARVNVQARPEANPQQTRELSQAFAERTAQPVEVIDPRKAEIPQEFGPVKTEVTPEGVQLITRNGQKQTPEIEIGSSLPVGRDISAPQVIETGNKAQDAAGVLGRYAQDVDAAKQLRDEAFNEVRATEQALTRAAKVDDVAEAQRIFGSRINELEQKASKTRLTDGERKELAYRRNLYDSTLRARKNLLEGENLVREAETNVTTRSSIETPVKALDEPINTVNPPIRAVDDIPTRELSTPQRPQPRQPDAPSAILDAQGRPLVRDMASPEIEIPNRPHPIETELSLPRSARTPEAGAFSSPVEGASKNVHTRPEGGEVYTQGRSEADYQALAQSLEKQSQIATLEAAEKLLADKKKAGLLDDASYQKQRDTLHLFTEAGRTGKTFEAMRREIQEGMGRISKEMGKAEVKTRDSLAPFAVTVRQIKPATYVSNLVKELGSGEAAQARMRELAKQYGITPTTKTAGRGDLAKSNAVAIAKQLAEKQPLIFSDVYLNSHNFKTGGIKTATDAPRGYPLRTFEQASIGADDAVIPQGATLGNKIQEQFQQLESLRNAPDISPAAKEAVTKVIEKPNVSFTDIRKMRKLVSESLEQFCNIWGLK